YAYIGFFKEFDTSRLQLAKYFLIVFLVISFLKVLSYIFILKYREVVKGNLRNVVVIGDNKKTKQLIQVFNEREEFGYNFVKQFSTKDNSFNLNICFDYITFNKIDEIYCSISDLKNDEISEIVDYADNNLKTLKFIPDNKNIFTKKLKFEYYDYI